MTPDQAFLHRLRPPSSRHKPVMTSHKNRIQRTEHEIQGSRATRLPPYTPDGRPRTGAKAWIATGFSTNAPKRIDVNRARPPLNAGFPANSRRRCLLSDRFGDISRGFTLLERHMGLNASRVWLDRELAAFGNSRPESSLAFSAGTGSQTYASTPPRSPADNTRLTRYERELHTQGPSLRAGRTDGRLSINSLWPT